MVVNTIRKSSFFITISAELVILNSNGLLISILLICYRQHFGGSTGYGHDEAGGRGALDQAFAEIFGAESAIVRSQVRGFPFVLFILSFY